MGDPTKKDYPPGWNDPPMLNYNSKNPPPKSRITNKRVPFPLGASSSQNSGQVLEPPKMPPIPTVINTLCIEDLYLKASDNFNKSLGTIDNETIKEQVWQLLSVWQNGKLSSNIQNLLTDLSVNIVEGNKSAASEVYLRLSMTAEETSLIKTYFPALKYLLNPPGNQ